MSDIERAHEEITKFLDSEIEKTLLICGIADKEKHLTLIKTLNARGNIKGLVFLIHTTIDGISNFFSWAGLYRVKTPKKYGEGMKLSNITLYFDNLTTKDCSNKYNNYEFDFIIVWPMQSVTRSIKEIKMLQKLASRQKTKKIIYITIKEPWYNPEPLESIVDRIIKLDCENDDPEEYKRIITAYQEDRRRENI